MRIRNKKTGEILESARSSCVIKDKFRIYDEITDKYYTYYSLAELNEEWEDAPEESKEWWYIDIHGPHKVANNDEYYQQVKAAIKEIGNYFETREEAEKAVEKLKAWKRLRDKGFNVVSSSICGSEFVANFKLVDKEDYSQSIDDFDCILGLEVNDESDN